jgi:hypothetical protein
MSALRKQRMKTTNQPHTHFVTPTQLSDAIGLPLHIIRGFRRMGAPGFRTDRRIALEELLSWYFGTARKRTDWLAERWRIRAERDQIALDRARGLVIEKKEVVERLKVEHARIRAALDRHIRIQFPKMAAGRSAEDIAEVAEACLNSAYTEIASSDA